jgi:LNS2 (Lipin/Ned1/Smp2)
MRYLLAATCFLLGCTGLDPGPMSDDMPGDDEPPLPREKFQRCTGRPYTLAPDEGWRHTIATPIITAAGAANHSGKDMLAAPGVASVLPGKFTYGSISKDLEDEDVLVFLDDCTGWTSLGRFATDSDGRMKAPAPALPTGVYEVRYQVAGDRSTTTSFLWVLPPGTRAIVSDIDATLTTSDSEVFQQIFDGSYIPETYPSAVAMTKVHQERGYLVFYMTGRPYWLSNQTRGYLTSMGFSAGPLRVTDSNTDILPTEGSVGTYKLENLKSLIAGGLVIDFAYGNATTDIYAYLGAGIPATKTWIIGDHAGEQGTNLVTGDWAARTGEVGALPAVQQPFDW